MGTNPGGAIVPSINCNGNNRIASFLPNHSLKTAEYLAFKPNDVFYDTRYGVMLFVKSGGETQFGTLPTTYPKPFPISPLDFTDVPSTAGKWKSAFIEFSPNLKANTYKTSNFYYGLGDIYPLFFLMGINNPEKFHVAMLSSDANTGKIGYFSNFIDLKLPDTANVGCKGDSVYLYAGASGDDYQWWFKDFTGLKQPISKAPYIYAKKPGVYIVEKKTNTCNAKDSTVVRFEPPTKPNLGKDTSICANSFTPLNLNANNPTYLYYRWNDDIDVKLPMYTAANAGKYWVETIDKSFCITSDTIEIRYGLPINTNVYNKNIDRCIGDVLDIGPDNNPNYNYEWNSSIGLSDAKVSKPKLTIQNNILYQLQIIDATSLCYRKDNISVTAKPIPNIELGNNLILCKGDSIIVNLPSIYSYIWSPTTAFSNPTAEVQILKPLVETEYFVTATYQNCQIKDSIILQVNNLPQISISGIGSVCRGDLATLTAAGANMYQWNEESATSNPIFTVRPQAETIYKLKGIDAFDCADTTSFKVAIKPTPTIAFTENYIEACIEEMPILLDTLILNSATSYNFFFNNTVLTDNRANLGGEYYVVATNSIGCSGRDSLYIHSKCPWGVYVPKTFSPNDDGTNDRFEIFGSNFKILELQVFNRWGEIIYISNHLADTWDGTYAGTIALIGVYPWMLKFENKEGLIKTISGSVTVTR